MERWQRYLIVTLSGLVGAFGIFSVGFAFGSGDGRATTFLGSTGGGDGKGSSAIGDAYDRILSTAVEPPSEQALTRAPSRG